MQLNPSPSTNALLDGSIQFVCCVSLLAYDLLAVTPSHTQQQGFLVDCLGSLRVEETTAKN